jgi:hypothetical protein
MAAKGSKPDIYNFNDDKGVLQGLQPEELVVELDAKIMDFLK